MKVFKVFHGEEVKPTNPADDVILLQKQKINFYFHQTAEVVLSTPLSPWSLRRSYFLILLDYYCVKIIIQSFKACLSPSQLHTVNTFQTFNWLIKPQL